jgi:hypothetical protein
VRKSLIDSLTLGCIPVLFADLGLAEIHQMWPLYWGSWQRDSVVVLPWPDIRDRRRDIHTEARQCTTQRGPSLQYALRQ